jgi:predicted aconitase
VRSVTLRLARWIVLCAACAAAGAAAMLWHTQRNAPVTAASCEQSPSEEAVRAELKRTQLALTQEEASRAELQKIADASAEQVSRLETELRILKGQRAARP